MGNEFRITKITVGQNLEQFVLKLLENKTTSHMIVFILSLIIFDGSKQKSLTW